MKLMTDKQMEEFLKIRDEKDSNIKAAKYIASLNLFDKEEEICQKKSIQKKTK